MIGYKKRNCVVKNIDSYRENWMYKKFLVFKVFYYFWGNRCELRKGIY